MIVQTRVRCAAFDNLQVLLNIWWRRTLRESAVQTRVRCVAFYKRSPDRIYCGKLAYFCGKLTFFCGKA
ncbi:MAG: hypothetical protein HC789_22160 [Microcoleus sp. CSU_2_2]|nr:hypothetical protein [Microcoleus sp. SU_5_3]NJS12876.1 hypothetical protein [Microcoleus sp. CSU_2_2]